MEVAGWTRTFILSLGGMAGAYMMGKRYGDKGYIIGAGVGVVGTALLIHFLKEYGLIK